MHILDVRHTIVIPFAIYDTGKIYLGMIITLLDWPYFLATSLTYQI